MKRNIQALSFTPRYDVQEDRIRLCVNYDDFSTRVDFMLTRSFILKLFPTLDEYMMQFYKSETAIAQVTQANIHQVIKEDKDTSLTDGSNLELYKQSDELLLEVKFSYRKDNQRSIVCLESDTTQAVIELDGIALEKIFNIIKASIPFFAWGISQNI